MKEEGERGSAPGGGVGGGGGRLLLRRGPALPRVARVRPRMRVLPRVPLPGRERRGGGRGGGGGGRSERGGRRCLLKPRAGNRPAGDPCVVVHGRPLLLVLRRRLPLLRLPRLARLLWLPRLRLPLLLKRRGRLRPHPLFVVVLRPLLLLPLHRLSGWVPGREAWPRPEGGGRGVGVGGRGGRGPAGEWEQVGGAL